MAFASRDDVLARAGRLGGAFSVAGRRPNLADVDAFAAQASDEVAEAVRGHGFDPDILDADATQAFTDLAAYGALARALRGLGDNSAQVQELLVHAEMVWNGAMGQGGTMAAGTFAAIASLIAGQGGGGPSVRAGNFWDEHPDQGRPEQLLSEWMRLRNTNLAPNMTRGQHL